ncbi:hypothetical protein [Ferroacidibacillus organovorans]|uniref:hypothetical protein n=1 Tax=Ferroacidibacillus organovorans TaxID=1765683 RepID=UPI0013651E50|nr:hypothetical protein [Ferroacidibacillus organovorans]
MQKKSETGLGVDPKNVHRANELPDALRTDRLDDVNFEAIRDRHAQEFTINPGRQKR